MPARQKGGVDRIAIIGCSGGGKSSLARKLAAKLRLPVVHLDVVFWQPGTRPKVEAAIARHAPTTPLVRLTDDRAIADWLKSVPAV